MCQEGDYAFEAVVVHARVKSLTCFLRKLEKANWSMFGYPAEVIVDLFGAEVIYWFVDDCYAMLADIQATTHLHSEI